jgi:6-pyruvoyl-tetrahydropterin synthase
MNVKVRGRIDPLSGFVIDYGFLKQVVKQLVIERLDHHNLNYAASDLAWRSSTELLSIYIWERLIHYLPDLYELQIYETSQSYCVYRGPTLDELQNHAVKPALKHFSKPELGKSALRSLATSVSKPHRHNIKQK